MTMFFQIRSLYKPASLYFTTYSISPAFQNLFNVPFSDFQLFGGALFPLPFPVVVNAAFLASRLLHFFSSNHAVLSRIKHRPFGDTLSSAFLMFLSGKRDVESTRFAWNIAVCSKDFQPEFDSLRSKNKR